MGKRLIYAEDAIDALDAVCDRECEYSKQQRSVMCGACHLGSAFDVIEQLPSAQPETHDKRTETHECVYQRTETHDWIPVTERLPEEDVNVLITYRYKEGEGDTSHAYIDITTYGQMYFGGNKVGNHKHWRQPFEYFTSNYEVVAWMPLPEPYKGEQE